MQISCDASRGRRVRETARKEINCPQHEPDCPNYQNRKPHTLNAKTPPHMLGPEATHHEECERPKEEEKN